MSGYSKALAKVKATLKEVLPSKHGYNRPGDADLNEPVSDLLAIIEAQGEMIFELQMDYFARTGKPPKGADVHFDGPRG